MNFYVVIYSDWSAGDIIKGVFTDANKADECLRYCEKVIEVDVKENGEYGQHVRIKPFACMDHIDFEGMIRDIEEQERKKQQAEEDAIKEAEIAEFNRIKMKYGL